MAPSLSLAGCLFLTCVFSFANAQPLDESAFKQLSSAELHELDITQNPGLLDLAARTGERVVIDITGPEQGGVVQDGVNVVLNCSSWLSNFPGGTIMWYRYLYWDIDHTMLGSRDAQTKSELNVPNSLRRIEGEFDEIFNITRVRIEMGAEDPHRGIYECEVCTARGNISEQCHSANVTLPIVGRPPILNATTKTPDPGPDEIYRIGSTICIRIDDDNHLNNRPLARVELKCPNVEAIPDENIPPDIPTPTRTWTHTSLDGTATAVMASDKVRREPEVTDEFIVAFPLLQPVNAMNIFVIVTRGDQDTLFFETFNVTRNLTERYDVLRQSFGFWTCKLNNSLGSVAATTFISDYYSPPATPSGLEQVSSANTLISATLTWQELTDTGGDGIDITHYTVYTSVGSPVNTTTLSHTLTGLEVDTDYTVSVTATSKCGLESAPSDDLIIRIPAGKQPAPTINDPVIQCDVGIGMRSLVNITWIYTDPPSIPSPEGLVYPPITDVTVSYTDSVDMVTVTACADLSGDDDSCSFNVSLNEDDSQPMYKFDVSVEVSNLGGSSVSQRTFEIDVLMMEYFLSSPPLGLQATLSPLCAEPLSGYFVQALFGVRLIGSEDCVYLQSSTQKFSSSHTVFIGLDLTAISDDYEYCARAILNEREKTIFDTIEVCTSDDDGESGGISAGAAAGVAIFITILMALPVGVLIGCWGAWFVRRRGKGRRPRSTQQEQPQQLQGAIYEEPGPGPTDTAIPLTDNQAYGHVNMQRRN